MPGETRAMSDQDRKPTIFDVARLSGASTKTVSRVINNERYVREETRERVRKAVAELGFQPNIQARTLAGDRSFLVGHFFGDKAGVYTLDIQIGLLERCRDSSYHLLIEEIDYTSPQVGRRVSAIVNQLRLDGVILTAPMTDHPDVLAELHQARVPFVRITPEQEMPEVPSVRMDERLAAATLVRHLLAQGHRRIGLIRGRTNHIATDLRQSGYEDALAEAGLRPDPALIAQGDFTFDSGLAPARQLLSLAERPTAIFAMNDEMAASVLAVAHDRGLTLPDELSVVGFDDVPLARMVWPPLTTARQPVETLARTAADILLSRLINRRATSWPDPVPHPVLPHDILYRKSVAPTRG